MNNDEKLNVNVSAERAKKEKKALKLLGKRSGVWIWPLKVFVLSVALSVMFGVGSEYFMSATGILISSFTILFLIIIAVIADLIGVAVAVCQQEPFNSMSARKIKGAKEALVLIKNANKVSAICNDVIGDICSIVAGAAGAAIAGRLTATFTNANLVILITAVTSALIAGITISAKALGKTYAIKNAEKVVLFLGRIISPLNK